MKAREITENSHYVRGRKQESKKQQDVAEGYSTLDLYNMSPKEVIELLDAKKITWDEYHEYQDLVIAGGPDEEDDFDYTDYSMRKGERGMAEGSDDWSGPLYDPALQGNGKKQRYEMMFKNGQVKRFSAMNDNEARKIAAGHGAKSVIRMKGNVPGDKIGKQGVAEGKEELHAQLQSINQKLKLMRGGPVGEPNSVAFVEKRKALLKQKEQILSQLKQGVAEGWGFDKWGHDTWTDAQKEVARKKKNEKQRAQRQQNKDQQKSREPGVAKGS